MRVCEFSRPIPSTIHPPVDRVSLGFILGGMTTTTPSAYLLQPSWYHYDIDTNSTMHSFGLGNVSHKHKIDYIFIGCKLQCIFFSVLFWLSFWLFEKSPYNKIPSTGVMSLTKLSCQTERTSPGTSFRSRAKMVTYLTTV